MTIRFLDTKVLRSPGLRLASVTTAALLASAAVSAAIVGPARSTAAAASRPNILFVMTDDQPKDAMVAMPEVRTRVRRLRVNLPNA